MIISQTSLNTSLIKLTPFRLTLSSIANMMEPEGYKTLSSILSQEEMSVLEASQDNKYAGLSDVDMQALLKVLER